jgi:pyrroline-5-carboxylate reductase
MSEAKATVSSFPRVAILGGGVIGGTLISALRVTGWPQDRIVVAEKEPARAAALREGHGITVDDKVASVVKGADVVIIAVKPQDVEATLAEFSAVLATDALVVTVAAALPAAFYESRLPSGTPLVRVMPNTPSIVAQGATAVARGRNATAEHITIVKSMLRATGLIVQVEEPAFDAVTAVSGCGPAYFYAMVEALIEAGIAHGLDRLLATQLAAQTFIGAARLLTESGESPQGLRKKVASPGGTTQAALAAMQEAGLQDVVSAGTGAAVARAQEMAKELGANPGTK